MCFVHNFDNILYTSYALSHKDKVYRGWKWCILKEAHLKSGELLEKPEEVNQQPSTN